MENIKMNEEIENININKKPNFYFLISIVLISFSIIISTYLYIMNNNILKNIENLNTKVETYNKEINELKNNKWVIAYSVVKSSIFDINNNIKKSEVYNYINEFVSISQKYKLNFTWFNYSSQTISASAISESSNPKEDSIIKIYNFIRDFRSWDKSIFVLDPISNISWNSWKRTFNVLFKVAIK